jgi:excisionase family DNA binding protein
MTDGLPELWDVDRVCAYLHSSRHLVYRLTRERRIRFVRVGKELRLRRDHVSAWLEDESVPSSAAQPKASRPRRGRPRNRDRPASPADSYRRACGAGCGPAGR